MHNENLMHTTVDRMTVADIRKALSKLRRDWSDHSQIHPIYTSTTLTHDMSMSEFCFRFVMGHHAKRHQKTH